MLLAPALIGSASLSSLFTSDNTPPIAVLNPPKQEPKLVPEEELIQYALKLINKDRADFGLTPLKLSTNKAAQVHAQDVFENKQISHWMSNGEKPYMTYTRFGGKGSVSQNVAIAGFSQAQYEQCVNNAMYDCERIDPMTTIQELEYEMMYKDKECCNDGHRNNILDKFHTEVSIGVVYDEYYLALVQNFENTYGIEVTPGDGQTTVSGRLASGTVVDHIQIGYDVPPTPEIYMQNRQMLSYSSGEPVAAVVKPLPPGYYYEQPDDRILIVADKWEADSDGSYIDVRFNLAKAVTADGVYTISVMAKEGDGGEVFEVTSYSVFIESGST